MAVKRGSLDLPRLPAIPVMYQYLLTLVHRSADICRTSAAFNHGLEISEQLSPAELMGMISQMAAVRIAIADDNASAFLTEQVGGHGPKPRSSHGEQRAEASHERPQPGLAAIFTPACFVHVDCGSSVDIQRGFFITRLHRLASG